MNNRGLSIFSVLFYGAAVAAGVIVLFSFMWGYGTFASKFYNLSLKQPQKDITAKEKSRSVPDMALRNVKFSVKYPKAKEVDLVADFNLWGEHKVKLEDNGAGTFSKTVILPQGEYKYYYKVDGKEIKDASAIRSEVCGGKEVSVRVVL